MLLMKERARPCTWDSDPKPGPLIPTQVLCGWGGGRGWQVPRDGVRPDGAAGNNAECGGSGKAPNPHTGPPGSPHLLPFLQPAVQPSGPKGGAQPEPGLGWMPVCGRDQVSGDRGAWAEGQAGEGLGAPLTGISLPYSLAENSLARGFPQFCKGLPLLRRIE